MYKPCIQAGLKEIIKKLTDILLREVKLLLDISYNSGNTLKSPISFCHFENFLGTRFPGSRTFSTSAGHYSSRGRLQQSEVEPNELQEVQVGQPVMEESTVEQETVNYSERTDKTGY